ncbi:MAG: hypothetical protein PHD97_06280 [Bacteroidales bacterium]|nr:hypothetical protein [Bacteroidales bacterium]
MKFKFDNIWFGVSLGVFVPLVALIIFYFGEYKGMGVCEFFSLMKGMNIFTKVLSLCVVPNLGLFFIFIRKNFLFSARGVLFATLIYALIVFILFFAL